MPPCQFDMRKRKINHHHLLTTIIGLSAASVLLSIISLYIFMYLFENVFSAVSQTVDYSLTRAMYMLRTPVWTNIMFIVTSFGADVTILGVFIVGAVFSMRKKKKEAILFSISIFIGLGINLLLKSIFERARPDMNPLLDLHSYSYPSGHAMNAFVFYGLLAFYLIKFTKKSLFEVAIAVVFSVLVILIGLSRIYLGVHYPTDVFAGYLAGFWVVIAVIKIDSLLVRHARF